MICNIVANLGRHSTASSPPSSEDCESHPGRIVGLHCSSLRLWGSWALQPMGGLGGHAPALSVRGAAFRPDGGNDTGGARYTRNDRCIEGRRVECLRRRGGREDKTENKLDRPNRRPHKDRPAEVKLEKDFGRLGGVSTIARLSQRLGNLTKLQEW